MSRVNPEMVKRARAILQRHVAFEKVGFAPAPAPTDPAAQGAPPMDPSMQGAPPMDPSMQGAPPMDPSMQGAPPMDPSMQGAPPPDAGGGGNQPVQINMSDLIQLFQMMQQQGAPAGAPAAAPEEGKAGKGAGKDGKLDMVMSKLDQVLGALSALGIPVGGAAPQGTPPPGEAGAMPAEAPASAPMPVAAPGMTVQASAKTTADRLSMMVKKLQRR